MNIKDLYINFFVNHNHKQIPSAPVVPENDPSVLFNTAGMQPLIPYLMGQIHPYGTRLVDYQKCIRTNDLESIGDKTHHTFFEMLGNWSLGDYFKEESIGYSFEFLTKSLNIPVDKLAITVFEGDNSIPRDEFSANCWKSHGISEDRIAYLGVEDNFWIAGESGPCGSDTEIFYWRSTEPVPQKFDPTDDRWVEIWNNVFMEYYKAVDGTVTELPKKNVDTGMGVERTQAILEGVDDNYTSSIWIDVIGKIEEISSLPYNGNEKSMRIIADHIRTSIFILADPAGIKPSNTDQGYVLRRLIRRAIRHARKLNIGLNSNWEQEIAHIIIDKYSNYYVEIRENQNIVLEELEKEKTRFTETLEKGLKEFELYVDIIKNPEKYNQNLLIRKGFDEQTLTSINILNIPASIAFRLYDTFGFPIELTEELANEQGIEVNVKGFYNLFKEHQEKSRAGAEGKFKGGLAGDGEIETKYHTATHLLNAALKIVVSLDVHQKGSNITSERMRFDFSYDRKLTDDEKIKTEELVNKWIKEAHDVMQKEMSKDEAIKSGAECMFVEKYPDIVTVYSIGDFSKELCGGPHVANTSEIGIFKIKKEEASSAGVRRIKAVIE